MADLSDRFPTLFFDIKQVEERTPKPLPSMAQIVAGVLSENGITNASLASSIAAACEQLVSLRSKAAKEAEK